MMRRALLRALAWSVAGGLPPRRPDQVEQSSPAGVAPGTASGTFRGRQVIVTGSGPGSGIFVYSGAPGKGNLVAAVVAPGTTVDPFGNHVNAVANFGHWSAAGALLQHFGIDQNGDTYLANASGLTVIHEHSADGSEWFYSSAGEGAGNLIASNAAVSGVDNSTNHYIGGGFAAYASTEAMLLSSAGLQIYTGSLAAGWTPSGGAIVPLASGAGFTLDGPVTLSEEPSPAAGGLPQIFGSTAGQVQVIADNINADGNNYDIQRLTLFLGIGANFTINSTTAQAIFSKHLGVGTYEVEVWAVTSNTTAADAAGYAFAFTGTANALVDFDSMTTGTAVVGYGASAALTTQFNGQGVAGNQRVHLNLTITVTAAGTLTFTGKELVAGNTVTVFGGSRMRICPVVAA